MKRSLSAPGSRRRPRRAVASRIHRQHIDLQEFLAGWEFALVQLMAPEMAESQRGLERLWRLLPRLEDDLLPQFRKEEQELFVAVRNRHPACAPLLAAFAGQHAYFVRQFDAYRMELLCCDALGEAERVHELGIWLVEALRRHMAEEEQELFPLLAA